MKESRSRQESSQGQKNRKPVVQELYNDDDYDEVRIRLPEIIKKAIKRANETLEPTIHEKKEIMEKIKKFIREKERKVYGGTAINETIKAKNPDDAIYDEYSFPDIEFYSPTPIADMIELTNMLYLDNYKNPVAQEAQHEETYTIFVNIQLYCDISYVPTRVYHGIKTIVIDGIHYVDPHFILIDQLRIINQPLTAADQRWEKTFTRMYKLLKNYPLEFFRDPLRITKPSDELKSYMAKIKKEYTMMKESFESCLICGFEAYNFYIISATKKPSNAASRISYKSDFTEYITNIPYLELVSVNYVDTVETLFKYIKSIVKDTSKLSVKEYYPLFQFTGHSIFIMYDGDPIVHVVSANGFCVPDTISDDGYRYVTYQYILMTMLINKFRSYLDKNKEMYFNYSIAISNLVNVRNDFLNRRNLGVINNTVFGEFKISCIGETASFLRASRLRMAEKRKQGKSNYKYEPSRYFSLTGEAQIKYGSPNHYFKNTSGNEITNPKYRIFKLDDNNDIIRNNPNDKEIDAEQSRVTDEYDEYDELSDLSESDEADREDVSDFNASESDNQY